MFNIWLFKFKIIKTQISFFSSTSHMTVLSDHMWLVAAVLGSTGTDICLSQQSTVLGCAALRQQSPKCEKDLLGLQKEYHYLYLSIKRFHL